MNDTASKPQPVNREAWWTREHALIVVLVAATALLLFLCWKLVQPFLDPIAWAIALAVIAYPLHRWIAKRVSKPGLAAALAVFVIALLIVAPIIFVGHNVTKEVNSGMQMLQGEDGKIRLPDAQGSWIGSTVSNWEKQFHLSQHLQGMAAEIGKRGMQVVTGSAWAVVHLLLTLFILFFLFRDRQKAVGVARSLVPLSERESDEVFHRVSDTIHATVFGTIVVAAVQGALGGLMFWWLGLPAPILWGAVMALLAIVPVLGAFVVWAPAAVFLASTGQWGKAAILTAWGGIVIALIDNLLYPILVGKRLRLHTVPVFFSIVGGLAVFGAAGIILGPVILALTDAILEIWRRRTANQRPAEVAVADQSKNA